MAIRVPIDARGAGGPDDEFGAEGRFGEMWEDRAFLRRYCERLVGDTATAEDIVQETYVRALRHIDQIDRRASFVPWLATVARNLSFNEARRRGRHPVVDEVPDVAAPAEADPAELFDQDERVRELLSHLTPRERELLLRQATEGLSVNQLAEEERSTVSAVRSVLLRARAKVRLAVEAGANIFVPAAALLRRMRRRLDESAVRVQQMGPTSMVAAERGADVFTAAVAAAALGLIGVVPAAGAQSGAPDSAPRGGEHVADAGSEARGGHWSGGGDGGFGWEGTSLPPAAGPELLSGGGDGSAVPADDVSGSSAAPGGGTGETPGPLPYFPVSPIDPNDPPEPDPRRPVDEDPVTQPEDANFSDFAVIPTTAGDPGQDQEILAIGQNANSCHTEQCSVLFQSSDGGATWEQLPAEGLHGSQVMVAPGYPADPRIYVMGPEGLQVSNDRGHSFHLVGGAGPTGEAAMPPGFSAGDERILIGSAPTWLYDADHDLTRPLGASGLTGPTSHFAFPSTDDGTGRYYAGSLATSPDGVQVGAVFRCVDSVCSDPTTISGTVVAPRVAVVQVGGAEVVLAWTGGRIWRSGDGGETFTKVATVVGNLRDVTIDQTGTMFFAYTTDQSQPAGGILRSTDAGLNWSAATVAPPFDSGAVSVLAAGDRLLAAPKPVAGTGVFCSADQGVTWQRRCA